MIWNRKKSRANLFIDYEIALKGLSETRSLLNIEITDAPEPPEGAGGSPASRPGMCGMRRNSRSGKLMNTAGPKSGL